MVEMNIKIKIDENVKIDQNKIITITKKEVYNWKNMDFIISNFLKLKQLGIILS